MCNYLLLKILNSIFFNSNICFEKFLTVLKKQIVLFYCKTKVRRISNFSLQFILFYKFGKNIASKTQKKISYAKVFKLSTTKVTLKQL